VSAFIELIIVVRQLNRIQITYTFCHKNVPLYLGS